MTRRERSIVDFEAKVRRCWPLRHRSPLHATALRLALYSLHSESMGWLLVDPHGYCARYVDRASELQARVVNGSCIEKG